MVVSFIFIWCSLGDSACARSVLLVGNGDLIAMKRVRFGEWSLFAYGIWLDHTHILLISSNLLLKFVDYVVNDLVKIYRLGSYRRSDT